MYPTSMTIKLKWARALPIALVLLASSCVQDSPNAAEPGSTVDETTSTTATGDDPVEAPPSEPGFFETVESRSDLSSLEPADVLDIKVSDSSLIVAFEMGSNDCNGAQAFLVEQGDGIVVDVRTGRLPDATPPCAEGIFPYEIVVPLEAPVEDRAVKQAEPSEPVSPTAVTVAEGETRPDVSHLNGLTIEEGVLWAIQNGIAWHLVSYDGVPNENEGDPVENRLNFVVEADLIVETSWT